MCDFMFIIKIGIFSVYLSLNSHRCQLDIDEQGGHLILFEEFSKNDGKAMSNGYQSAQLEVAFRRRVDY